MVKFQPTITHDFARKVVAHNLIETENYFYKALPCGEGWHNIMRVSAADAYNPNKYHNLKWQYIAKYNPKEDKLYKPEHK